MSDETTIETLKTQVATLTKELEEAKKHDDYNEVKNKYEQVINDKDKEIQTLKDKLEETETKVNETIESLTDEAKEKLAVQEKLKEFSDYIAELEKDKAETLVDTFINQGKLLPAQKEKAFKMACNDYDSFYELYKDAKPVIELKTESKKIQVNKDGLKDYFKDI